MMITLKRQSFSHRGVQKFETDDRYDKVMKMSYSANEMNTKNVNQTRMICATVEENLKLIKTQYYT